MRQGPIVPEDDGLVFVSRDGEVIEPGPRPQFPATFPPVFPRKHDRLADDARCAPPAFQAGGRRAEHRPRLGQRDLAGPRHAAAWAATGANATGYSATMAPQI